MSRISRSLAALLLLFPTAVTRGQEVLYGHPATSEVIARTVMSSSGQDVDLFLPPGDATSGLPAVVFVLGFPDGTLSVGPLRNTPIYQSWARLVAAEGMVGILYATSDPEKDLTAVMEFLRTEGESFGIDSERVALWCASGNGALALDYVRSVQPVTARALVAYYPLTPTPDGYQGAEIAAMSERFRFVNPPYEPDDSYPPGLPIYLVRAGEDNWTELVSAVDHFIDYALRNNLNIRFRNYPEGHHSFDALDDTPETQSIIAETLVFLREALAEGE
jgi:dienelactone hydrolase